VASVLLAVATVGALIASCRRTNLIGWLLCGANLLMLGSWLALVGRWMRDTGWFLILTFLLLFPTGRLPTPRWRPSAWIAALLLAYYARFALCTPHLVDALRAHLRAPRAPFGALPLAILLASAVALVALMLPICSAAPIVRFHGARGVERAQLKWFAYAVVLAFRSAPRCCSMRRSCICCPAQPRTSSGRSRLVALARRHSSRLRHRHPVPSPL
jgi:hypothetical protein